MHAISVWNNFEKKTVRKQSEQTFCYANKMLQEINGKIEWKVHALIKCKANKTKQNKYTMMATENLKMKCYF